MYKIVRRSSGTSGLPPGTPVYVGEKKAERVRITLIDYDERHCEIERFDGIEECFPYRNRPTVTWINVDGLHEVSIIEKLGSCFNIHPLIVEDILNTEQRPKIDVFDEYLFLVIKMHSFDEDTKEIEIEQMSMILGENYVLTFHESEGDIFDAVRARIKNNKGTMRKSTADYLAYALLDAVVDNYFKIIEEIGEEIDDMEEEIILRPGADVLEDIHVLKREMIHLRKSIWPLREIINTLERGETRLVKPTLHLYLRDLYDHTIQIIDTVETYRDMLTGMHDTYLSSVSNRMNEVMKFLTIIGTIFIPLTFIAGIYGMNFEFMPELKWHWGYFGSLGLMAFIGGVLLLYFKRKRWL